MNRDILEFVTFCIGVISLRLNMPRTEVFERLSRADIINGYIVPCYDVLHTFSRPSIVEELTDYMREKGVLE